MRIFINMSILISDLLGEVLSEASKSKSFFEKLRNLMASDGTLGYFKTRDIIDWPTVSDSEGDSEGTLDLENNEFIRLDKNKLIIITGGDWQDAWYVEIVNELKGLKVKKYRLREKGDDNKDTRMSYFDIVQLMYSDHELNNSVEDFMKYIKTVMRDCKPYIIRSYEEENTDVTETINSVPTIDKDDMSISVIWDVPGYEDKRNNNVYGDVTQEEKVEKKLLEWLKGRFWSTKKCEYSINNKKYKIKAKSESLGDNQIKFTITLKE